MLSLADKDLMEQFVADCSIKSLSASDNIWAHAVVPQGVAVFKRHHNGRIEYMFTKDDKFDMKRDDINDLRELVRRYVIDDYIGLVFVMHSQALKTVSKHIKYRY